MPLVALWWRAFVLTVLIEVPLATLLLRGPLAASSPTVVERALAPVDAVRGALLRRAARSTHIGAVLAVRERRVALILTAAIVSATLLATMAPVLVYLLSPVVLGVPHLASDLRYLLLRRARSRALVVAVLGWCAALVAVRVAELAGVSFAASGRAELLLAGAGIVVALVAVERQRPHRPRTLTLLVVVALLLALVTAWVLHGDTYRWIEAAGGRQAFGIDLLNIADQLAPRLDAFGVSLTVAFVLWQSLHYAIWLHVIPSEQGGPRSFRQSWRALRREVGTLASFHAYLELAALAVGCGAARARSLP